MAFGTGRGVFLLATLGVTVADALGLATGFLLLLFFLEESSESEENRADALRGGLPAFFGFSLSPSLVLMADEPPPVDTFFLGLSFFSESDVRCPLLAPLLDEPSLSELLDSLPEDEEPDEEEEDDELEDDDPEVLAES